MTEVVKGSNRVRGQKNAVLPSLLETGDSPAYGTPNNTGISGPNHKFIPSLIETDQKNGVKAKNLKSSGKGGASLAGGTTTRTIKGK